RILILDEPTAVLTPAEVEDLFELLREIAVQGSAVIIVTHKLREVLALADTVTVLRHGRVQGSGSVRDTDAAMLTELMVPGGAAPATPRGADRSPPSAAAPALIARRIRASDRRGVRVLDDVSLAVPRGTILAIAGVEGNGQAELFAALAAAFEGDLSGEV